MSRPINDAGRRKAFRDMLRQRREVEVAIVAQVARTPAAERRDVADELIDKAERRNALAPGRARHILAACGLS